MAVINSPKYTFLKKEKLNNLMRFIGLHWKKNHILAKSKKLILWQHYKNKNYLNFFVCKINNKMVAAIGIINFCGNINNKQPIGLAVWCCNKKYKNYGGLLFKELLKHFSRKPIIATGLNDIAIKFYNFFGFKISTFKKFYICPIKKKYPLSKNLKCTKSSDFDYIKRKNFLDLYKFTKNKERNSFLRKRYEKHPFYEHIILKDDKFNLFLIGRIVKVNKFKFLRILDFEGNFNNVSIGSSLVKYCILNDLEHVEFLYFGYHEKFIKKSGFKLLNEKKEILPILTEPYQGLKKKNIVIAYKNLNLVNFVKGDVDADRPNINK